MEFHEFVGLDDFYIKPLPPRFSCIHCDEVYISHDELRQHRFENHPLHRPTLFLQGQELSTHPVRITRPLTADDVKTEGCNQAFLNGRNTTVRSLPDSLTQLTSGIHKLVLRNMDVSAKFMLDFRIASEDDLMGIEDQFKRIVRRQQLDICVVDEFISATSGFGSALGYCDGICEYLYGVLAKEQAPASSLPYEAYVGKFSKAVEELANYKRPLARMIGSLVVFHFNHFGEAARLASDARVGRAAARFEAWLKDRKTEFGPDLNIAISNLDALVTDWETEQIVCWAVRPLDDLSQHVRDMEAFLKRNIGEYDRVKLHILLGEAYAASGDIGKALQHTKTLRNLPPFDKWAEAKIRTHSKDHNEHL